MPGHPGTPAGTTTAGEPWSHAQEVVVDVANLLGSRPDGWWRDRAGATTALLQALSRLAGTAPRWTVVLEGRARDVDAPAPLLVVRAEADGDTAVVDHVAALVAGGAAGVVVVTADRGLRARLPAGVATCGPGALRDAMDALDAVDDRG